MSRGRSALNNADHDLARGNAEHVVVVMGPRSRSYCKWSYKWDETHAQYKTTKLVKNYKANLPFCAGRSSVKLAELDSHFAQSFNWLRSFIAFLENKISKSCLRFLLY